MNRVHVCILVERTYKYANCYQYHHTTTYPDVHYVHVYVYINIMCVRDDQSMSLSPLGEHGHPPDWFGRGVVGCMNTLE